MFEEIEETRPDGEQPLKFYYNREERIKKASKQVQEYYNGGMRPVKGIKSLFYKGNKFVFLALIFFVAATWIFSGISKNVSHTTIDGIKFDAQSFIYEREVYTNIKVYNKKADAKSVPKKVDALVSFVNSDGEVSEASELSLVYKNGEEYLRTKATDYDIIKVNITITVGEKTKELTTVVQRL